MWEIVTITSVAIAALAYVAGYAIRRIEDSRKDLARQVILLSATSASSRGARNFLLAQAQQEGQLTPHPSTDNPMQDDEWESLVEGRRRARNRDLMNEWVEET